MKTACVVGLAGLLLGWAGCSSSDSGGAPVPDASTGGSRGYRDAGSGGIAVGTEDAGVPDGTVAPPDGRTEAGQSPQGTARVTVSGVVRVAGPGGVSPLDSPRVTASVDRDGDGELDAGESVTVTGGEDGAYSLGIDMTPPASLVVSFGAPHLSRGVRVLPVKSAGDFRVDGMVSTLHALSCDDGSCADGAGTISLTGLPRGYSAEARIYDPVTETFAFPGTYADDRGNLLLSGVFAYVALRDGAGDSVTRLASPALLRMKVPRTTRHLFDDIHPGDGRVTVPLYSFDEVRGHWVADGEGILEDAAGAPIPENQNRFIRDGRYQDELVVRAEVSHFSYWNVDWPVAERGCLSFQALDADGEPATAAVVDVQGLSYPGSSGTITGADGRGCVDVMRSEIGDEDLDRDFRTGEVHRVSVRLSRNGNVYDGRLHDIGTGAASCGGACTDLGVIRLDAASHLESGICTVRGVVRDMAGNPVAGGLVTARDPAVPPEDWTNLCGADRCDVDVTTASDGSFSYRAPLLSKLTVSASSSLTDGTIRRRRFAEQSYLRCPEEPADFVLDSGFDEETLTVRFAGGQLSWVPNRPVHTLRIFRHVETRWEASSTEPFQGPVTYGVVPEGAQQEKPEGLHAPTSVLSGDEIELYGSSTTPEGFDLLIRGFGKVPAGVTDPLQAASMVAVTERVGGSRCPMTHPPTATPPDPRVEDALNCTTATCAPDAVVAVDDGMDTFLGCTVVEAFPNYNINVRMRHAGSDFGVSGSVSSSGGLVRMSYYSGATRSGLQGECSLTLEPGRSFVAAGRIWARITCPKIADSRSPGPTDCAAEGVFLFQNCSR